MANEHDLNRRASCRLKGGVAVLSTTPLIVRPEGVT